MKGTKRADVLINNAGLLQPLTYDNYPDERRDYSLALNLISPVKLTELLTEKLLFTAEHTSRMFNNAAIAGQIGHPDIGYGMGKGGVINAIRWTKYQKSYSLL